MCRSRDVMYSALRYRHVCGDVLRCGKMYLAPPAVTSRQIGGGMGECGEIRGNDVWGDITWFVELPQIT